MSMPRIAFGVGLGLVGVVRELDAAGLAAAADLDLGLDHDGEAELLGSLARLLRRGRMATLRHGHAVLGEELLALVFEQVHVSFRPPAGRGKRLGGPRLTGAGRYQQT